MADATLVAPPRAAIGAIGTGSTRAVGRPSEDSARNFQNSIPANDSIAGEGAVTAAQFALPQGAGLLSTSALLVLAETRTQESIANETFPAPANLGRAISIYTASGNRNSALAVTVDATTNI